VITEVVLFSLVAFAGCDCLHSLPFVDDAVDVDPSSDIDAAFEVAVRVRHEDRFDWTAAVYEEERGEEVVVVEERLHPADVLRYTLVEEIDVEMLRYQRL
jgi:hypothetical protein